MPTSSDSACRNPWIHYGPNPCNSTASHVNAEGGWIDDETARPARITCVYCRRKNAVLIANTVSRHD